MDLSEATALESQAKAKKKATSLGKLKGCVNGVRKLVSKKKGIVYQGIISLPKSALHPKGKKVTMVHPTEEEAVNWRKREIAKLTEQALPASTVKTPGEMLVPALLEFYEREAVRQTAKKWSKDQKNTLARLSRHPLFVNLRVVDVLPKIVTEWAISRRDTDGVHASAIRNEYSMLNCALTRVGDWEEWGMTTLDGRILPFNPLTGLGEKLTEKNLISKSRQRDRTCEGNELPRLLAYLKAEEERHRAKKNRGRAQLVPMADIIAVMAGNAFRGGEMVGRLLWTNLREKGIYMLRKATENTETGTRLEFVPLHPQSLAIIHRQPRRPGDDRIFPYTHKLVGSRFKAACVKLGIKDMVPHDMRHEGATNLSQFMQLADLMLVMGHTDPKTTKRYLNPKKRHVENVHDKMANVPMELPPV